MPRSGGRNSGQDTQWSKMSGLKTKNPKFRLKCIIFTVNIRKGLKGYINKILTMVLLSRKNHFFFPLDIHVNISFVQ